MTAVFVALLNRSIAAGWLILAVILLRMMLHKAPRWSVTLLWAMVGVRLICPLSIQSVLSLIPSAHTVPADIGFAAVPAIDSGVSSIDAAVNPIVGQFAPTSPFASVNPIQIFGGILANLWFLGLVAMLAYAAFTWLRLAKQVRTAVILRDNVYRTDAIDTPFVLGLLKPRIYLPFSLKEPDLSHVLSHEQAHIRRKDHWWKPLGFLLLSIHWFNPLVWIAWMLLCRDIELACDEAVIRDLDRESRADYSQALLSCSRRIRIIAACPLAFGEVGVKERVNNVIRYKKPAFWLTLIAAVVCIAVAVCFLTDPAQKDPPDTVTFQGVVLEVHGDSILALITESSVEDYYSDRIYVNVTDFDLDLHAGDTVTVKYNGIVLETYPPQIVKPYSVQKTETGSDPQDALLDSQLLANIDGILYTNPGTPSPMEVDPSAIRGSLQFQVEGRPAYHSQANFDCEGCSYARVPEGYAILIENEWYLFTEAQYSSPRYYLTVGEEGVSQLEIRADGRTFLMIREPVDATGLVEYRKGDVVELECLTGRPNLRGVTVTARDADNNDLFSLSISSRNYGTAEGVIECDDWSIVPAK